MLSLSSCNGYRSVPQVYVNTYTPFSWELPSSFLFHRNQRLHDISRQIQWYTAVLPYLLSPKARYFSPNAEIEFQPTRGWRTIEPNLFYRQLVAQTCLIHAARLCQYIIILTLADNMYYKLCGSNSRINGSKVM